MVCGVWCVVCGVWCVVCVVVCGVWCVVCGLSAAAAAVAAAAAFNFNSAEAPLLKKDGCMLRSASMVPSLHLAGAADRYVPEQMTKANFDAKYAGEFCGEDNLLLTRLR